MKNKPSQKNIPKGWSLMPAGEVFSFVRTYAFSRDNLVNGTGNSSGIGNIHYGDIHSTYKSTSIDLNKVSVPMIKDDKFAPNKEDLLKDGDLVMADASEDYEGVGVTVSLHGLGDKKIIGGLHTFVLRDGKNRTDKRFRQYIFRNPEIRNSLQKVANGVSVYGISKKEVSKMLLPLPPLTEQNRIVAVLETWDQAIQKLSLKIEKKKNIKKGLMQELLTGKKRLLGFSDKWSTIELGEILDYEQPVKYLVKNSEYSDSHKIPVLTANKGFVLGYTDEVEGIYSKGPVIIFDDFTTDNKFVDFPFKVKSSAIKLLTSKNSNADIRFVYERIQLIKFMIGQHKRHYISEYQYLTIDLPSIKEQKAISEIIVTIDDEIKKLRKKLNLYKNQKRYFLNNLITGAIRTPETLSTIK